MFGDKRTQYREAPGQQQGVRAAQVDKLESGLSAPHRGAPGTMSKVRGPLKSHCSPRNPAEKHREGLAPGAALNSRPGRTPASAPLQPTLDAGFLQEVRPARFLPGVKGGLYGLPLESSQGGQPCLQPHSSPALCMHGAWPWPSPCTCPVLSTRQQTPPDNQTCCGYPSAGPGTGRQRTTFRGGSGRGRGQRWAGDPGRGSPNSLVPT